jgi:hypothetical protein
VSLATVRDYVLLGALAIVGGWLVVVFPWYLAIAAVVAPFGLFFILQWPERVLWIYMVLLPLSHGVFVLTIHQGEVPLWREAMLGAVALGMGLRIYWRRRAFSRGVLPLAVFLAFFMMLLLSGWDSDSAQYRAGARALLPSMLVLAAAAAIDISAVTARRILLTIFWLGAIEAAVGISLALMPIERLLDLGFEYAVQVREVGFLLRAFGTFRDPFGFAHFTMVCVIAMWAARRTLREALPPAVLYAGIVVIATGVVMSFVRDALVGTAVGISVCEIARRRFTWPVLGAIVLSAVALGALALAPTDQDFEVLRWDNAANSRLAVWTDLLTELGTNPLGRGLGTVGAAAERALEDQGHMTRDYDPEGQYVIFYDPVDSQYVLFLMTGGVLAFGMFWAAVVSLVLWVRRHMSRLDSPWTETLTVAALGVLASLLVAGITRNILEEYPTGVIFWLVTGLLVATIRTTLDAQAAAVTLHLPVGQPAGRAAGTLAVAADKPASARRGVYATASSGGAGPSDAVGPTWSGIGRRR